jgi:hypothetical protein
MNHFTILMLRQAQHKEFFQLLTLSLSKGEEHAD